MVILFIYSLSPVIGHLIDLLFIQHLSSLQLRSKFIFFRFLFFFPFLLPLPNSLIQRLWLTGTRFFPLLIHSFIQPMIQSLIQLLVPSWNDERWFVTLHRSPQRRKLIEDRISKVQRTKPTSPWWSACTHEWNRRKKVSFDEIRTFQRFLFFFSLSFFCHWSFVKHNHECWSVCHSHFVLHAVSIDIAKMNSIHRSCHFYSFSLLTNNDKWHQICSSSTKQMTNGFEWTTKKNDEDEEEKIEFQLIFLRTSYRIK